MIDIFCISIQIKKPYFKSENNSYQLWIFLRGLESVGWGASNNTFLQQNIYLFIRNDQIIQGIEVQLYYRFFHNYYLKPSKMQLNNHSIPPLLQFLTKEVYQQINEVETVLQTIVKLESQTDKTYKLKLKGNNIILYTITEEENQDAYFLTLDFSVKFEKILASIDYSQNLSYEFKSQTKGFRLIHQNGLEISFFIRFADLTNIWVKYLSKYIHQLGFHKYFKPMRKLGKGGSASVYQIMKIQSQQRYAAKVFSKQNLKDALKLDSFQKQVEMLSHLEHKNLLKFEGVFETEKSLYVITEVMLGGNLLEYLMRRTTKLNIEEIRTIMRNIVEGLVELDELGIIHRDIKMENIMLRQDDSLQPVIVDYGLAVYFSEDQPTYKYCGTPGYLSPEVIKSANGDKITSKTDVFSAAIVFHILLMGQYLFSGKDSKAIFENNKKLEINLEKPEYSNIDNDALDLLKKMLTIDASQRFSAYECLQHSFLREEQAGKVEVSPASTSQDYHF